MNDAASFGFFAVIVILIIAFVIAWQIRSKNELTSTYQRLARRFQGRCNIIGLWDRPSVNFVYKNAYVLLDIYSSGGKSNKYYTQLRINWPDSSFRCEVSPAGVLSRVGKFFGMGDIEIGSPRFDADYVITGNDVSELREFLTRAVQQRINELRSLGRDFRSFRCYGPDDPTSAGDIYIAVSGGQLLIKKRGLIREYAELEAFTLLSLDLSDQATQASAEGIEFVENKPEATLSLREAVCQICGESVKLDAVFCRSCKTPHHKDCWEYYGACSTYGCGQRRYLVQSKR